MDGERKENSELASLKLTKDFLRKVVTRIDIMHSFFDEDGIFHCSLIDMWLGRVKLF